MQNCPTVPAPFATKGMNLALIVVAQDIIDWSSKITSFILSKPPLAHTRLTQTILINELSRRLFPIPDDTVIEVVLKTAAGSSR